MQINVVRTDFYLDVYAHESSAHYFLKALPSEGEVYDTGIEVVGTIEIEEILSFGLTGEIEAVRINGREYNFAGVNPFANKVVFDDGQGHGPVFSL